MRSMVCRRISVLVLVLLFAAVPLVCAASGPGVITDVRVSSDMKRIIIRTDGDVPEPAVYKPAKASTLVMDFGRAIPAKKLGHLKLPNKPIREIRTDRVGTGTRVAVDFGEHAVPSYRVRKIENCFLVFLSEFKLSPDGVSGAHVRQEASEAPRVEASGSRWVAAPATTGPGKLMIKSANAVAHEIVVDIADRRFPEQLYRVRLDVDLERPALDSAEIVPVPRKQRSAGRGLRQSREGTGEPVRTSTHPKQN